MLFLAHLGLYPSSFLSFSPFPLCAFHKILKDRSLFSQKLTVFPSVPSKKRFTSLLSLKGPPY